MPKKFNSQGGAIPILVLIAAVGFLVFIFITNTANFKDRLFSALFPKPPSKAVEEIQSVPDEILVKFKPGVSDKAMEHVRNSHGLEKLEEIIQIGLEKLKVSPEARDKVIEALQKNPNVEIVSPNYLGEFFGHSADTAPSDPKYIDNSQWNLAKVSAPSAWDTNKGSPAIIVAVIDSGAKGDHEDLQNKLVPGYNAYANNTDTSDPFFHGTAVSGIIGAETGNAKGIASLGWNIKIMPIRITNSSNKYDYYSIDNAIVWATDHGAKVINMSFGYTDDNPGVLKTGVDYAYNRGVVLVAANGNSNNTQLLYPAAYENVVAVGATNSNDERWVAAPGDVCQSGSSFGGQLDVVAPGKGVISTKNDGTYAYYCGTSFSAPHVSALAALIFSVDSSLTNKQVMDIIMMSADDLGTAGRDDYYGMGRINAARALQQATGITPPPPDTTSPNNVSISSPSSGTSVFGLVDITANASDNIGVTKVEFYVDGVALPNGIDVTSPYLASWDTSTYSNASHIVMVKAYDLAGNVGVSPSVSVSVNNPSPTLTPLPTSGQATLTPSPSPTPSPTPSITVTPSPNRGKGQGNKK